MGYHTIFLNEEQESMLLELMEQIPTTNKSIPQVIKFLTLTQLLAIIAKNEYTKPIREELDKSILAVCQNLT